MRLKFFLSSIVMWTIGGALSLVMAQASTGGGGGGDLGSLALNAINSIEPIVSLIVALCYVSGIGFAGAGVLKFKQHKENPAQVPLGTCFMLLFIGIGLVWLPTMIEATGITIFGSTEGVGSPEGGDIFD